MSKHTTLSQLRMLAQRTQTEISAVDHKVFNLATKVETLENTGGQPNVIEAVKVNGTALAIAEKVVDILITTGSANGSLSVNGIDVLVKGLAALAFKAQVSETDLDEALKAVIDSKAAASDLSALVGTDTGKTVRTIANEELAAQLIPEAAQESMDTLTELAAWIHNHPNDVSAINASISKLQAIVAGIGGEADEYATVIAAIDGKIAAALTANTATDDEVTAMLTEVFGAEASA